jgi:hypothetical protein
MLWVSGRDTKAIGFALEITIATVNVRLKSAAAKMCVTRSEIKTWVMQNPAALDCGTSAERGLHPRGCRCPAPYCLAMRSSSAVHPAIGCRCQSCVRRAA